MKYTQLDKALSSIWTYLPFKLNSLSVWAPKPVNPAPNTEDDERIYPDEAIPNKHLTPLLALPPQVPTLNINLRTRTHANQRPVVIGVVISTQCLASTRTLRKPLSIGTEPIKILLKLFMLYTLLKNLPLLHSLKQKPMNWYHGLLQLQKQPLLNQPNLSKLHAFFTSYKTLRKEDLTPADYIEDAQGKISKPHGIGTVVIDIGTGSLILRDVRHVPSFNSNLISMGMLLKQGFRIEFPSSSQVAQITTSSGAEFEAILNTNNVFILSDCISPDESSYAFVTTRSGKEAN
ncbi:hypothetical protein MAP00_007306 [Monascus purpureus]|nr:hypothetical protein MAP00_007306 [Monascus purpureus]